MSEPTLDKLTFELYTEDGVDYYSVSAAEGATGDCVVPASNHMEVKDAHMKSIKVGR